MDSTKLKLQVPGKELASIAYHLFPATAPTTPGRMVVFLNGMMGPQMTWHPVIKACLASHKGSRTFGLLTYDRYAQLNGLTQDSDPTDVGLFGHDLVQVATDLDSILEQLAPLSEILLVSNSIGGPLSRIYAANHPGRVAGLIFLDSNPAHCLYDNDVYPDPAAPDFDPKSLPPDITVDELKMTREIMHKLFSPSNPNKEGLDRRNLAQLLPSASKPKLMGPGGKAPYVTVVGHDVETFTQEGYDRMKISKEVTKRYLQPYWEEYNQGLLGISDREAENKVKIAKGTGHLIQLADPHFVAKELNTMLQKLDW